MPINVQLSLTIGLACVECDVELVPDKQKPDMLECPKCGYNISPNVRKKGK